MCVLYVRFVSKVRPRTFGCVAMGYAVLPHQRPQCHVAHPIRYDRVLSQVYTNSVPRLTCPITPVGQSHPVSTSASTAHFVHGYNDTHIYNNA